MQILAELWEKTYPKKGGKRESWKARAFEKDRSLSKFVYILYSRLGFDMHIFSFNLFQKLPTKLSQKTAMRWRKDVSFSLFLKIF